MNWDQIQGNWKEFKEKARQQWRALNDNDLDEINGNREQLEEKLTKYYGYAKDKARREVDNWFGRM